MQAEFWSHLPVFLFKVKVSRQSVQMFAAPEHLIHGDSHLLHSFPTLVKPEGQLATQFPSENNPMEHEHTPLTGLVFPGQFLRQSPLDK